MLYLTDKKVFNTGADCIVNTINCVGFMGKGLALEFALRYPELEAIYKKQCAEKMIHTGQVYFYNTDGQKIINFPTKFHFKYSSKLEWIEQGLDDFKLKYQSWDINSVAFPILGARNGGLDPDKVLDIMKQKLSDLDIDVYICRSRLIEGKEKEMIDGIKSISVDMLAQKVSLSPKQKIVLSVKKNNIINFSDISEFESIGKVTYKAIFDYFYRRKNDSGAKGIGEQMSIFEANDK